MLWFCIWRDIVFTALKWLKFHNRLYSNVRVNKNFFIIQNQRAYHLKYLKTLFILMSWTHMSTQIMHLISANRILRMIFKLIWVRWLMTISWLVLFILTSTPIKRILIMLYCAVFYYMFQWWNKMTKAYMTHKARVEWFKVSYIFHIKINQKLKHEVCIMILIFSYQYFLHYSCME